VNLILQGVGGAPLPPLRFDPDSEPLFFTHHPNWSLPELEVVPVGLAFEIRRAGRPWPRPVVPRAELAGESDTRVPKDYLTQNLIGHFHYMVGMSFESRDWRRAAREFLAAEKADPRNDVLFYNLGLIYRRNGLYPEALVAFSRSQAINSRAIPGHGDARAEAQVAELRLEVERLRLIEAELVRGMGAAPIGHLELAAQLERRGEGLAARGHRLREAAGSPLSEDAQSGAD
jgi:tetratricopeptide (TPR) repeat protein